MKRSILFASVLATLFSCKDQIRKESYPMAGSFWESNFYHYRNKYYFTTDSDGFSRHGQFLWSTPVDTALFLSSRDSVVYDNDIVFSYQVKDTSLVILYRDGDKRIFYFQPDSSFASRDTFAYGREVIYRRKR